MGPEDGAPRFDAEAYMAQAYYHAEHSHSHQQQHQHLEQHQQHLAPYTAYPAYEYAGYPPWAYGGAEYYPPPNGSPHAHAHGSPSRTSPTHGSARAESTYASGRSEPTYGSGSGRAEGRRPLHTRQPRAQEYDDAMASVYGSGGGLGGNGGGNSGGNGGSGEVSSKNQLDLAAIESGADTRTTVMVKNIPNKMSDRDLLSFIGKVCPRKIDFLYLRMDFQNGACSFTV